MTKPDKPHILIVEDDPTQRQALQYIVQQWNYEVHCAADKKEMLQQLSAHSPDLVLLDLRLGEQDGLEILSEFTKKYPNLPVVILTAYGSVHTAVTAMKLGAYDFLTKPPDRNHLKMLIEQGVTRHRESLVPEHIESKSDHDRKLLGESTALQRVRSEITTVAPTDATVLILGESGTGKELVARSVHDQSRRADGPFVAVNMAALPHELAEATLFGHVKGAFTGADASQRGSCESADGGTLFLDEIGEMDFSLQSKLLRFLQERIVQRVGSTESKKVDVRVLSATNRDPQQAVQDKRLREDLYYRLNVVPIVLPPLRERPQDILPLAEQFLIRASQRHGKPVLQITQDARQILEEYDWPGNVRQLENLVERLVVLTRTDVIDADTIPVEIRSAVKPAMVADSSAGSHDGHQSAQTLEEIERQAIIDALRAHGGVVSKAAAELGLGQATVYRKIKRYGIDLDAFRP